MASVQIKQHDCEIRTPHPAFERIKRVLDITLSATMLLMLLPLLIGCATWIKIADGGPIFYHQWRVGRDGWLFCMCKFRTMRQNAELTGIHLAAQHDPRILRGCAWMRRSHIDELPQLIHVFMGQMSMVGPRPERPEMLEQINRELPRFNLRLAAAPGLTGLAQVHNGYSNDLDGMRRKLNYDLQYLHHRSVMGDLRVLLATIPKIWDRAAC